MDYCHTDDRKAYRSLHSTTEWAGAKRLGNHYCQCSKTSRVQDCHIWKVGTRSVAIISEAHSYECRLFTVLYYIILAASKDPSSPTWPNAKGFDQFFGYNDQAYAHNYYPYWMWRNQVVHVVSFPGSTATCFFCVFFAR